MRTSALVRIAAGLVGAALAATLVGPGVAHADDTPAPVVVNDTITLYPGQGDVLDVLANDTAPSGDALALCRFPEMDFLSIDLSHGVIVSHDSFLSDDASGPGDVSVILAPRARGTHVIEYFVCDSTHLVPATLTIVVRPVEPVDVRKVRGKPGRLRVTNHNDRTVRFWYGDVRATSPDGRLRIPAGATRTVRVQRHRIVWVALIGGGSGKSLLTNSPGIADIGIVRDIKLRGEPLPRPKDVEPDFRGGRLWLGAPTDA